MQTTRLLFMLAGALVLSAGATSVQAQKFEGLADTPPMGWNSWNKFHCDVNEQMIRAEADAMVASGMKDAGYEYINIDDCWQVGRDSLGFIVADPDRFPSGMKALADYVHSKGLKFGLYSCAGSQTCAGRPAGRGHEYQDALMYAKWGVDYLKYDWCHSEKLNAEGAYMTMRDALYAAGRPIVFSLCEWGANKPWLWAANMGQLWRTTGDIMDKFEYPADASREYGYSVVDIIDMQDGLRQYAGPGHWNDPDMLEVGNGFTVNEDRAHFTMWCMLAAPLIAGNDLRTMSDDTREVLTNKAVIALDQDPLGIQGFKQEAKDGVELWLKPLANDEWAICIFNRNQTEMPYTLDWANFSVTDTFAGRVLDTTSGAVYTIEDLWQHKSLGKTNKTLKATIPGHDVLCVKLTKK